MHQVLGTWKELLARSGLTSRRQAPQPGTIRFPKAHGFPLLEWQLCVADLSMSSESGMGEVAPPPCDYAGPFLQSCEIACVLSAELFSYFVDFCRSHAQ